MLRQLKLETRTQSRSELIVNVVGSYAGVVEPDRHIRAPLKSLGIGEVGGPGVLMRTAKRGRAIDPEAVNLQRTGKNWIKAGNRRPTAEG